MGKRSLRSINWVEAKHPRDDRGRFAKKGSPKWFANALASAVHRGNASFGDFSMGAAPGHEPKGRLPGGLIDVKALSKAAPRTSVASKAPGVSRGANASAVAAKALGTGGAKAPGELKVGEKFTRHGATFEVTGQPKSARRAGKMVTLVKARRQDGKEGNVTLDSDVTMVGTQLDNPRDVRQPGGMTTSGEKTDAQIIAEGKARRAALDGQLDGAKNEREARAVLRGLSKQELQRIARDHGVSISEGNSPAELTRSILARLPFRERRQPGGMTTTPEKPKRTKARKGDLVVVSRETTDFYVGSNRSSETRTEHHVAVVSSVDKNGIVQSYSTNADGSYPRPVDTRRETTAFVPAENVDVAAVMKAADQHVYPNSGTRRGFDSLDEVKALVRSHAGDQTEKIAAARAAAPKGRDPMRLQSGDRVVIGQRPGQTPIIAEVTGDPVKIDNGRYDRGVRVPMRIVEGGEVGREGAHKFKLSEKAQVLPKVESQPGGMTTTPGSRLPENGNPTDIKPRNLKLGDEIQTPDGGWSVVTEFNMISGGIRGTGTGRAGQYVIRTADGQRMDVAGGANLRVRKAQVLPKVESQPGGMTTPNGRSQYLEDANRQYHERQIERLNKDLEDAKGAASIARAARTDKGGRIQSAREEKADRKVQEIRDQIRMYEIARDGGPSIAEQRIEADKARQAAADARTAERKARMVQQERTPWPSTLLGDERRHRTFVERMAGDLSEEDRRKARAARDERIAQEQARSAESQRQYNEMRAGRTDRENLEADLQTLKDRRDLMHRSGRMDDRKVSLEIKGLQDKLEAMNVADRKAKIKEMGVKKGDKVKNAIGEHEVNNVTKDGYLRIRRPDGKLGGYVDPMKAEKVEPTPEPSLADELRAEMKPIDPRKPESGWNLDTSKTFPMPTTKTGRIDSREARADVRAKEGRTPAGPAIEQQRERLAAERDQKIAAQREYLQDTSIDPKDNGAKLRALDAGEIAVAKLYRKVSSGPSGQTKSEHVGTVTVTGDGEYQVKAPDGTFVGWMRPVTRDGKSVYSLTQAGPDQTRGDLLGWNSSPAEGADILVNGEDIARSNKFNATRRSLGTYERHDAAAFDRRMEARDRELEARDAANRAKYGRPSGASVSSAEAKANTPRGGRTARVEARNRVEAQAAREQAGMTGTGNADEALRGVMAATSRTEIDAALSGLSKSQLQDVARRIQGQQEPGAPTPFNQPVPLPNTAAGLRTFIANHRGTDLNSQAIERTVRGETPGRTPGGTIAGTQPNMVRGYPVGEANPRTGAPARARKLTSGGKIQPDVSGDELKTLTTASRQAGRALPAPQRKALDQWVGGKSMVRKIQTGQVSEATMTNFDDAMRAMPKVDGLVYRGVNPRGASAEFHASLRPGQTIELGQPVSTSIDPRQSGGFGANLYEIEAPGSAAYLGGVGANYAYEKEAVLAPGRFEVVSTDVVQMGLGSHTVPVSVVRLRAVPAGAPQWKPTESGGDFKIVT